VKKALGNPVGISTCIRSQILCAEPVQSQTSKSAKEEEGVRDRADNQERNDILTVS